MSQPVSYPRVAALKTAPQFLARLAHLGVTLPFDETIGRALQFVPKERLFPCTNCGLAPMGRDVAWRKLQALAEGTRLAREGLAAA